MSETSARPAIMTVSPPGRRPIPFLRTTELGTVFRDTTSSYKYYWLLAIIHVLPEFEAPLPTERLVREMIVRAWAAVALFRLSLGRVDRLQDCVRSLQESSGLPPRSSARRLRSALDAWGAFPKWADELVRFVPGRFLASWFPQAARETPYDRRGSRDLMAVSDRAFGKADSGPYRLIEMRDRLLVELAPGWRDWLTANQALVLGFAEQQLARYLQARNPNVPGVIKKLELPRRRSLALARIRWAQIIDRAGAGGLVDIFSNEALQERFEVDHFLPWSFVVHDEFWNLAPVNPATNRSKSDHLPALDLYLPRLAGLHADVLRQRRLPSGLAEAYAGFFGVSPSQLSGLTQNWIEERYSQLIRPLAQIAANQGFPAHWHNVADTGDAQDFAREGGGEANGLIASRHYEDYG